jgi:hypothetical protein
MSSELATELSRQTLGLVARFEQRADSFKGRTDLAGLLVPVDVGAAESAARELLGEGEHSATGIDGSMDFDERLQMILFYANATAYSCPFTVGEHVRFDLDSAHHETKLEASAAVPLWAEDLNSVFSKEPELDIELEHSIDRIPNSFMTLGELFLAWQAASRSRIVFLDRPLSGTYSTLSRDARNLFKRGETRLTGWVDGRGASMLDLELAVSLGPPSMAVPLRGRFLPLAAVRALQGGPKSIGELAESLRVDEQGARQAVKGVRRLDKKYGNRLLRDPDSAVLELSKEASGFWERVTGLAEAYTTDVFSDRRHPLAVGQDQYLNILDVNTVALVMLLMLCERAAQTGALVVGIAKDTTATDITRAVLPFASSTGYLRLSSSPPRLKNDRAFLSILSSENPEIRTPWRTVGYDSSFSTMVEVEGGLASARKVVSREGLFIRSFFQLRTLKSDPSVRSQVFLFDRVCGQREDSTALRKFEVKERGGPVVLNAYFEGDAKSRTSNLILHLLSLNDNPEVFEAYGHNQLLYLADKAVKAEIRMMRSSLHGVADLRVGGVSRRRKIFGLVSPYRQQRAEAEHRRARQ